MKKTLAVLAAAAIMAIVLAGCQEGQKDQVAAKSNVLPEVVGIWRQVMRDGEGGNPWALLIEESGLVEARMPLGDAVVKPNSIVKMEMRDGQFSTFDVGPAYVNYDPKTREMTLAFDLKQFQLRMGKEIVEGKVKYAFTGPVSEDGKAWSTTFAEDFDYGPQFPMDPNGIGISMYFKKEPLPVKK